MEQLIKSKFANEQWEMLIIDGTKLPVNLTLRKQLKRLRCGNQLHDLTQPPKSIFMDIYFENGQIPIESYPRVLKNKEQNDPHQDFKSKFSNHAPNPNPILLSQSSIENVVSKQIQNIQISSIKEKSNSPIKHNDVGEDDKMENMEPLDYDCGIVNIMSSLVNNAGMVKITSKLRENDELVDIKPPSQDDEQSLNIVMLPADDDQTVILEPSRKINEDLMKNISNDHNVFDNNLVDCNLRDDILPKDVLRNDLLPDDILPNDLVKLRKENVNALQKFDLQIAIINEKLSKFTRQVKKMMKEREEKEAQLTHDFHERYQSWKKKKSAAQTHKKGVKRLSGTH